MRIAKQAGVVVGLLSGIVGLLFLFLPQLKPEAPPLPPAEQLGTLSGLILDPDATRGQYLERTDQSKLGLTTEQLARRGAFIRFRVEILGYKGKKLPLQRELVDAQTGDEIAQLRAVTFKPPVNRVASPWHDWAPLPAGMGSYVLVIKLLDERGVRAIACTQSAPFGGLAGSLPAKRLGLC